VDPEALRWQAVLQSNRAASNMRLGKFAAAIGDCHQALGLDPENARAHLRRARAYVALKDYDSAIRDFRRYLSWTPPPSDRKDVEQEFSKVLADQRIEQHEEQRRAKEQQQRNSWKHYSNPYDEEEGDESEGYEDYSDVSISSFLYEHLLIINIIILLLFAYIYSLINEILFLKDPLNSLERLMAVLRQKSKLDGVTVTVTVTVTLVALVDAAIHSRRSLRHLLLHAAHSLRQHPRHP